MVQVTGRAKDHFCKLKINLFCIISSLVYFVVFNRTTFILLIHLSLPVVKLDMNISSGFDERLSSAASIVLSLWLASSGLAAVIRNAVVLWLFYKNQSLRTILNRFLASLCVADFLAGLVVHPLFIAIRVIAQPRIGSILQKVIGVVWIHTTAATVFNLCCVSVDRFIAIRFPFRYQDIITKKRCYVVIMMVWLISLFLPCSRILLIENLNEAEVTEFWFSLSFIFFKLPIIVVTLCYICVFTVARKQASKIKRENLQNSNEMNASVRAIQNYKALKTIGLVLGVFIVSSLSSLVVSLVEYVTASDKCFYDKLFYIVWPWIEAVGLTSSAINPWIYYFRNGEFREALRRCFHRFPLNLTPEFPLEQNGIREGEVREEAEL